MATGAATDPNTQTLNTVYEGWGSSEQLASWGVSSGKTACNMTGITCDSQNRVVSLSLYDIPTGFFSPLLFSLTSLSSMSLVRAGLLGSIPEKISQMVGLQTLKLGNNVLTGEIPPSISLAISLTSLQITSNQIAGILPVSLSCLTALATFYAPFNLLHGSIPAQYSTLQQLTMLYLASNSLTSSIPPQLTSIMNLTLLVNHNPAMCGWPMIYGPQDSTSIGWACFDPLAGKFKLFGMKARIMTL